MNKFFTGIGDMFIKVFGRLTVSNVVQYLAFLLFVAVSMLVSANFFVSFSTVWFEQAILFVVSVGLELFKIYCLIQGYLMWEEKGKWRENDKWFSNFKWGKFFKALRKFLMYTILAGIAIFSSYAYSLSLIKAQSQVISATVGANLVNTAETKYNNANSQLTALTNEQAALIPEHTRKLKENTERQVDLKAQRELEQIDWKKTSLTNQINVLIKARDTIDTQFEKDKSKYKEDIENKTKEVATLKDAWDTQKETSSTKQEEIKDPSNQIAIISEKLGMDKDALIMIVMMFVSIMVEAGIVSTAPHALHQGEKKNDSKPTRREEPRRINAVPTKRIRKEPETPELSSKDVNKTNNGNNVVRESVVSKKDIQLPLSDRGIEIDKNNNTNSTQKLSGRNEAIEKSASVELKEGNNGRGEALQVDGRTNGQQPDARVNIVSNKEQIQNGLEALGPVNGNVVRKYIFGSETVEFKNRFIEFVDELFLRNDNGTIESNVVEDIVKTGKFDLKTATKYFKILEKITGVTGFHIISGNKINYNKNYIIKYLSMEID